MLVRIDIECTIVLFELPAAYIFGSRQIDFHFRPSVADHGNDRHACTYCFVGFEQMFVYIAVKRCTQSRVGQLVFMVIVFGCDLF